MRRLVYLSALLAGFLWPLAPSQPGPAAPTGSGGSRIVQEGTVIYRGRPVTYQVVDGLAVVEGDIVLGTLEDVLAGDPSDSSKQTLPSEAIGRPGERYRWPNGVIPYTIDPELPDTQRILDAVQHWNDNTPIKLVPHSGEGNYVHFLRQNANGVCSSAVGMVGGRQLIRLDDLCGRGTIIHEIGHAVGLWHEQSRHDRNAFIRVLTENIDSTSLAQFSQQLTGGEDIGPYDYSSIMHYSSGSFSRNGSPTLASLPAGIPFGQRSALSAGDIDAVQRMYGQPPGGTVITTNPGGLEIVVDEVSYQSPQTFHWAPGSVHTVGVPAAVQSSTTARWAFGKWSDDGDRIHSVVAEEGRGVYVANFVRELRFQIRALPADGGSVQVTPASDDGYYPQGVAIRISATPNPGYYFSNWTMPAGRELHGSAANPAVLAAAAYNYAANFTTTPQITVTSSPEGLPVTVDGRTWLSPRNFVWTEGSVHSLAADEVASPRGSTATRYRFQGWSGDGGQTLTVAAPAGPAVYTANYTAQYQIGLVVTPPLAGRITLEPNAADGFYDAGAVVEVRAVPSSGYRLQSWSSAVLGGAENPRTITVSGEDTITATFGIPGQFTSAGIVHAASFQRGPLSPGGLVTIFGVDIGPPVTAGLKLRPDGIVETALEGMRVLFDGIPGPLLYVSPNQINAVTPFGVAGKSPIFVQIERGGLRGQSAAVTVADARPAIFRLNAAGQGAILNEDGSVNSPRNPAAPGSIVSIFATGGGRTSPALDDGKVATYPFAQPMLPVTVRIDGRLAEVHYTGAAPDLVAGVLQINARIPDRTVYGNVPVMLKVGERFSEGAVTVAVGVR